MTKEDIDRIYQHITGKLFTFFFFSFQFKILLGFYIASFLLTAIHCFLSCQFAYRMNKDYNN
jgi:hypothetical protein